MRLQPLWECAHSFISLHSLMDGFVGQFCDIRVGNNGCPFLIFCIRVRGLLERRRRITGDGERNKTLSSEAFLLLICNDNSIYTRGGIGNGLYGEHHSGASQPLFLQTLVIWRFDCARALSSAATWRFDFFPGLFGLSTEQR